MGRRRKTWRGRWVAVLAVLSVLVLSGCDDLVPVSWGANASGQLGNNSYVDSSTPVNVDATGVFAGKSIIDVSGAAYSSCAVATDGTVACWGMIYAPSLVNPPFQVYTYDAPYLVQTAAIFGAAPVTKVAAGLNDNCALASDGTVGCWGLNGQRQMLGYLDGRDTTQISVGAAFGCALTSEGKVACWGDNKFGQLGDGTTTSRLGRPEAVNTSGVLAGKTVASIYAGERHACALATDGTLACWGANDFGQIGDGSTTNATVPVAVDLSAALPGTTPAELTNGYSNHTCVVGADGSAACWGRNFAGQLGDGTDVDSSVPVQVASAGALAGEVIQAISAGMNHTCALVGGGSAACWGLNVNGQLGDNSNFSSRVPVAVAPPPGFPAPANAFLQLAAGGNHNLALYDDGSPTEFVPIEPVRAVDTRDDVGVIGPLDPSFYIVVDASQDVPPGTTAIAFNITATGQTASGYLDVAPDGAPAGSSTVNWSQPLQTIANGHITKLSADRKFQITLESTGTTHVVLDVTGYFAPVGTPDATKYQSANRRIYDSRPNNPLLPGASRTVNINAGSTPAAVPPTAAAINVTVTGTSGSGVVTAARNVSSTTSTINWSGAAQTVANAVITDVAPNGDFTLTNNGQTPAHVVVDLTGTFAPTDQGATGAQFYAMDPARTYDSRLTIDQALLGGQSRTTTNPVPDQAVAVVLNTTITGNQGTGFLSVTPPGFEVPTTSTVNWYAPSTTRANGSIIPTEGSANRSYAGGNFSTHYVFDLAGYFR